eukprot:CAMPEP_0172442378 /NCGR_PEP_ID=MMETSP1065-20121228/2826_1 /TAXON_ID=265537 /ORGANISM="Amphiprora paludosa, Strain CCMP125" /LENGTH=274 /DNA_ID=CAMNT_0013192217 /DNA_START=69 /DNA_END=893 /DNA_ORIENTATION=+
MIFSTFSFSSLLVLAFFLANGSIQMAQAVKYTKKQTESPMQHKGTKLMEAKKSTKSPQTPAPGKGKGGGKKGGYYDMGGYEEEEGTSSPAEMSHGKKGGYYEEAAYSMMEDEDTDMVMSAAEQPCDEETEYCQIHCYQDCPAFLQDFQTDETTATIACEEICECEAACVGEVEEELAAIAPGGWDPVAFHNCYVPNCLCEASRIAGNFYVAYGSCNACALDCGVLLAGESDQDLEACEALCDGTCLEDCTDSDEMLTDAEVAVCFDECIADVGL